MAEFSGIGSIPEAFSRAYDTSKGIEKKSQRIAHTLKIVRPHHERVVRERRVSEHMRNAGILDTSLTNALKMEQLGSEDGRCLIDSNESVVRITNIEAFRNAIDTTRSTKDLPEKIEDGLPAYFTGIDLLINPNSMHESGRAQILDFKYNEITHNVDFKILAPFEPEFTEPHSVQPVFDGTEVPDEFKNRAIVERTGVVTEHRRFPKSQSIFLDQIVNMSIPSEEIFIVSPNYNLRGVKAK